MNQFMGMTAKKQETTCENTSGGVYCRYLFFLTPCPKLCRNNLTDCIPN